MPTPNGTGLSGIQSYNYRLTLDGTEKPGTVLRTKYEAYYILGLLSNKYIIYIYNNIKVYCNKSLHTSTFKCINNLIKIVG